MRFETRKPSGVTVNRRATMNKDVKAAAIAQEAKAADQGLLGVIGAVLLGTILLFSAGFAQATVMHDTSHDMRHAMAFPCH